MSPYDLGLETGYLPDRFDTLYKYCKQKLFNTTAYNTGRVYENLSKIESDLNKLKTYGDESLLNKYKSSLVPHLERLNTSIKYLSVWAKVYR